MSQSDLDLFGIYRYFTCLLQTDAVFTNILNYCTINQTKSQVSSTAILHGMNIVFLLENTSYGIY